MIKWALRFRTPGRASRLEEVEIIDPTPRIPSTPPILSAEFHKMANGREKWKVPRDQEDEIEGDVSADKTRHDL